LRRLIAFLGCATLSCRQLDERECRERFPHTYESEAPTDARVRASAGPRQLPDIPAELDRRTQLDIRVSCETSAAGITLTAHNNSSQTIYHFSDAHLPFWSYLHDGSILVLFGIEPPDERYTPNALPLPPIRAMRPGERFVLSPHIPRRAWGSYYSLSNYEMRLRGRSQAYCVFGYLLDDACNHANCSTASLSSREYFAGAPPVEIVLP